MDIDNIDTDLDATNEGLDTPAIAMIVGLSVLATAAVVVYAPAVYQIAKFKHRTRKNKKN
jgi:hypothetical protein